MSKTPSTTKTQPGEPRRVRPPRRKPIDRGKFRSSRWAFGRFLQARRHELGYTTQQIADAIGTSTGFIQLLEMGTRGVPPEHIPGFARVLEINEDELRSMVNVAKNGVVFEAEVNPILCGLLFWHLAHKPLNDDSIRRILRACGMKI